MERVKRKNQPPELPEATEPVALELASAAEKPPAATGKVYVVEERPVTLVPCVVCGAETDSEEEEKLCWVCRRLKISAWRDLKISAWRDSELVPAQE